MTVSSHKSSGRPPFSRRVAEGGMGFIVYSAVMRLLGLLFEPLSRWLGRRGMPWVFLLPNMAFFTLFQLLPIVLLVYYSLSSGPSIFADQRQFVGLGNYRDILTCGSYLDPNTCTVDLFLRGVWNTLSFVAFEVAGIMIAALLTALVLNHRIKARGFFRTVFFYPVLLSPVIVALIWKWLLQDQGLLNAALDSMGLQTVNWLLDPGWSRFFVITAPASR